MATDGLVLCQTPPEEGKRVVVAPVQRVAPPAIWVVGLLYTRKGFVGCEAHPVTEEVNLNVVCPTVCPVTKPVLVMLATAGLELTQVPPEVGERDEVPFTQTDVGPVNTIVGIAFTVINADGFDTQPELKEVSTKAV